MQNASMVPKDLALVLVFSINPFGEDRGTRYDQDGIDVNRNFHDHEAIRAGFGEYPHNREYKSLTDVINPRSVSWWHEQCSKLLIAFRTQKWLGQMSRTELIQGISRGQYDDPKGMQYGGRNATWSNRTFSRIMRMLPPEVEHFVGIDFHDGLRPNGQEETPEGPVARSTFLVEYVKDSPEY